MTSSCGQKEMGDREAGVCFEIRNARNSLTDSSTQRHASGTADTCLVVPRIYCETGQGKCSKSSTSSRAFGGGAGMRNLRSRRDGGNRRSGTKDLVPENVKADRGSFIQPSQDSSSSAKVVMLWMLLCLGVRST